MQDLNILIVDDDKDIRDIVQFYLVSFCSHFWGVASLEEACYVIQKNTFDIALVDLEIKKGSGFQVIDFLESQKQRTSVVIMSGRSQEEVPSVYLERVQGLLLKPFQQEDLIKILFNLRAYKGHLVA